MTCDPEDCLVGALWNWRPWWAKASYEILCWRIICALKGTQNFVTWGVGWGVAASVQLAVLSLSLLFRLQVPEPVCKGPITYQVLTSAGAA